MEGIHAAPKQPPSLQHEISWHVKLWDPASQRSLPCPLRHHGGHQIMAAGGRTAFVPKKALLCPGGVRASKDGSGRRRHRGPRNGWLGGNSEGGRVQAGPQDSHLVSQRSLARGKRAPPALLRLPPPAPRPLPCSPRGRATLPPSGQARAPHLFELPLPAELADEAQQMVAVCSVELIDADQGLQQADIAAGKQGKETGLQLLQL